MPTWALLWQMFNPTSGWAGYINAATGTYEGERPLLMFFGTAILALQAWMVVEAVLMWRKAKGVLEEGLPPLKPTLAGSTTGAGRSC